MQSRDLFRRIRSPRLSCFPLVGKAEGAQSSTPARPAALRSQIWLSLAEEAVWYSRAQSLRGRMPKTVGFKWGAEAAAPLRKRPTPSLLTQPDCAVSGPWPSAKWHKASSIMEATRVKSSGNASSRRLQDVPQPPSGKGRVAAQPRVGAASPPFSAEGVRVEGELSLGVGGGEGEKNEGKERCPPPASLLPTWPAPRSRGTSSADQAGAPRLTLSSSKLISPSSSVSRSSGSSPTMARSSVGAPRGRRRLRRRCRGDSMGQGRRLSCCSRLSLCFLAKFTNTCKGSGNSGWSPGLASHGRGLGWWGQKREIWGLPRWMGLPIILSQPMTPAQ